jgi:hypothetical protein
MGTPARAARVIQKDATHGRVVSWQVRHMLEATLATDALQMVL